MENRKIKLKLIKRKIKRLSKIAFEMQKGIDIHNCDVKEVNHEHLGL